MVTKAAKSPRKRSQSAKAAAKAASARAPAGKPAPSMPKRADAKVQEVDPSQLPAGEAQKRCGQIYKLERVVERKRAAHDVAKRGAKAAKDALAAAEEGLAKEIHDQRFGPGPLFSPDGKGAAK